MNLRMVALFSLLPGAKSGRLISHTLLFNIALAAVLASVRRRFGMYGLVSASHLLLDADGLPRRQALWPALGPRLANVGIGRSTKGLPYLEQVAGRLRTILTTYSQSGSKARLIDVGGLLALVLTWKSERRSASADKGRRWGQDIEVSEVVEKGRSRGSPAEVGSADAD